MSTSDSEPDPDAGGKDAGSVARLTAWAQARAEAGRSRVERLIAENEDRPLADVGLRLFQRDRQLAGTLMGSAIAFRLFLFFVPMLVFIVGFTGFLAGWGLEPESVVDNAQISGSLSDQIRAAFDQPGTTQWVATLGGLVFMTTAGRTLSKVLVAASAMAWRLPPTSKASLKVVGALVGLVSGIGLLTMLMNRVRAEAGLGVASISFLAVFAIHTVIWLAVSLLLPRATPDRAALLPGAVLVGATVSGMQAVSQFYLPDKIGRASEIYGAIGTTIVTLGWFFIMGRVMVIGMALNVVLFERFGGIAAFVFSLPVLRVIARRSAWVRRFFGLDEPPAEEDAG